MTPIALVNAPSSSPYSLHFPFFTADSSPACLQTAFLTNSQDSLNIASAGTDLQISFTQTGLGLPINSMGFLVPGFGSTYINQITIRVHFFP